MRVLILGAAGFIGKECANTFIKRGFDVLTSDLRGTVDLLGSLTDEKFVSLLPDVDVIINCAAVHYITKNLPLSREKFFFENNVQSAKNLYKRYRDKDTHFIHIGTSMMYCQNGSEIYSTKSKMCGSGIYSRSKIAAQQYIDLLPNTTTIIPCIVGGVGREGLFRSFIKTLDKWGFAAFPGKGKHKISFIHVADVVSFILIVAQKSINGLFNVAARDTLSIEEWVDEIAVELNIKNPKKIKLPLKPLKIVSRFLNYRILAHEQLLMLEMPHVLSIQESLNIGWQPKFNSSQTIRAITRYIKHS